MNAWYKIARFLGKIILYLGPPVLVLGPLPEGPAILFCNHYSFLDPILLAIILDRRLWFLAMPGVLKWKIIGWVIRKCDWAFSISPKSQFSLRQAIKLLKQGKTVVIFPEGTRSDSIQIQNFKPGLALLTRYAKAVPVAIVGTFECLPRGRLFPRRHKIKIIIGQPIEFAADQKNAEIVKVAKREISQLLGQTR
ncbi:MAG: 1-acyl-sn-glycerol-3-phosphate acyltransferase [Candidatus Portnoybacteria bacterium CG_4_8_14_3_um_filter_40_10]|uniref:1-acyl-sn-glycerol-3-phosphate acyltransferase n=1 Tax=Candidatus Portnoybacteria bacterium CG_4_8_14_3_um_filter_40_10 TaxID=1974801 RepID=A0A2M7IHU1_9BACT|nr:MAG: 1-acyl-sn-glycerol-3-phosphate acyltransferase [Candidatus Portnoybacteria bacterium CG_4_8_14_3_um_filter_40_10]